MFRVNEKNIIGVVVSQKSTKKYTTACMTYEKNFDALCKKDGYKTYKKDVNEILTLIKEKCGPSGKMKTMSRDYEKPILELIKRIILDKTNEIIADIKVHEKINLDLFEEKYEPTLDLVLTDKKNKKVLIELKGWLKDTNSLRSAILNAILIKNLKSLMEERFYFIT